MLLTICSIPINIYAQDVQTNNELPAGNEATSCCTNGACCSKFSQTPVGVMTDHMHTKGQLVFFYSFMDMTMEGNKIGTKTASNDDIAHNYMMATDKMNMQMHMLMAMYGITNRLTAMLMVNVVSNDMTMKMMPLIYAMPSMPGMNMGTMANGMTMSSMGLGDAKLSALYRITENGSMHLTGSFGISIPTGSIKENGTTMLGDNQKLSYCMQTGTGSIGFLPGITFVRQYNLVSWGIAASADVKMNYNSAGYKYGNVLNTTSWVSRKLCSFMSASLRAEGIYTGKISGMDKAISIPVNITYDPTASTTNYGGQWVNMYAGLNFYINKPVFNNFHLLTEFGMPVYQNLNGIQMSLHHTITIGLQYSL